MEYAHRAAEAWAALKQTAPLVHNITNYVSMDVAANVLLAAGALPAMIHTREEAADFASIAAAVTLNIGTLSPRWVDGMEAARQAAKDRGVPVVLDPVGAGATPYRTEVAVRLVTAGVDIVRANASEILALAGAAAPKGVDSAHSVDEAIGAARDVASRFSCVVAATGSTDRVTDGERECVVDGGHVLMTKVTALGCALSALVAAFATVEQDALCATAFALAVYALAGEQAARTAAGPGSFRVAFVDALYLLEPREVARGVRIR